MSKLVVHYSDENPKASTISGIQCQYQVFDGKGWKAIQTKSPIFGNLANKSVKSSEFFFAKGELIAGGYFFADSQVNKIYLKTNFGQEIDIGMEKGVKEEFPSDFKGCHIMGFFGGVGVGLQALGFYYNRKQLYSCKTKRSQVYQPHTPSPK